MATLQQQVQQHLQNTGISLRELSRRSGVSHTTIGKILKGGEYKSETARALYAAICITPISEYVTLQNHGAIKVGCTDSVGNFGTLHDKVEAISVSGLNYAAISADTSGLGIVATVETDISEFTLDATVEQLAAQCIDSDLTHVRDDALECGKQRRIAALEAEVSVWRKKADKAELRACDLDLLVQRRDAELNDANTAYLSSKSQHERDLQRLNDANAEIKRLTALSETQAASWKAACVRSEQLEKQLDHGQAQFKSLQAAYDQQVDDEREMLAQIDKLFAERDNMRTEYEYSLMRLRVRCFALVCVIVFLIVSGLVVWGAV